MRYLRSSARSYVEGQLVAADADMVAIGEGGAASDAPALHQDSVSRSQIADHKAASGVDDDGVVATDVVVVEHDVVVESAANTGRASQRIALSVLAAQLGAGTHAVLSDGVRAEIDGAALGGGLGGAFGVQRLLAQDPLVQGLHRRTGIDAEILGEVHLQSS